MSYAFIPGEPICIMKIFKLSCGLVLLLSSCKTNQEKRAKPLVSSWAVSRNHLFSYAQRYFYEDYTCFYFSLETGNNQLGKYRILGNTLFCESIAVRKIKQIHEKKMPLIPDTDTLHFIDSLAVDKRMLTNGQAFRTFTDQFRRREMFYLEKFKNKLKKEYS